MDCDVSQPVRSWRETDTAVAVLSQGSEAARRGWAERIQASRDEQEMALAK